MVGDEAALSGGDSVFFDADEVPSLRPKGADPLVVPISAGLARRF
jgi:hypothetical protein